MAADTKTQISADRKAQMTADTETQIAADVKTQMAADQTEGNGKYLYKDLTYIDEGSW